MSKGSKTNQGDTRRRIGLLFAGLGIVAITLNLTWKATTRPPLAASQATTHIPTPTTLATTNTPIPSAPGAGYFTTIYELQQRKRLADQGVQPYTSAVRDLLAFANDQLKNNPSPQEPLDIPGTTGPFVDDARAMYGLALAYGLTDDTRYASKAREFVMAWVNTTNTTLHTCPDKGNCQTSLIIGRSGSGFVFTADLIKPSGVFSTADDQALKKWLRAVILPAASLRDNNWGDAGVMLRVVLTDYLGDHAGFDAAISDWKRRVDLIAADGHIPAETERAEKGINYTQGALTYKLVVATIAERRGIDLWNYGRLKQAVDYVAPYVLNPAAWPWESGASADVYPLWELAYTHWQEDSYRPIIRLRRPFNRWHSTVSWTTLTNGIPFG
jgi:hypothetical protein